jgi:4-hydroxy-2-oxoheptanedioate aldolase
LETPEDAKKLVESAKFPPKGRRGFGSPFSMEKFGIQSQTQYLQEANDALLTIVQIETKEALENVDAIAQVDGIDVLLVGPFDLGNNIGHPILDGTMSEELKDAIATIRMSARDNGISSGIYATSGEQAREFADQGFQMVC